MRTQPMDFYTLSEASFCKTDSSRLHSSSKFGVNTPRPRLVRISSAVQKRPLSNSSNPNLGTLVNYEAFVKVTDETHAKSYQFNGATGSFKIEKGASVVVVVDQSTIRIDGRYRPEATVEYIDVISSDVNAPRGGAHAGAVSFVAEANMKVIIRIYYNPIYYPGLN